MISAQCDSAVRRFLLATVDYANELYVMTVTPSGRRSQWLPHQLNRLSNFLARYSSFIVTTFFPVCAQTVRGSDLAPRWSVIFRTVTGDRGP